MLRAWCVPLLVWIAGCASDPSPTPQPKTPALPSSPPPAPWSRLAEVEAWPPLNTVPFPSRGHLTSPSYASVRVSPDAREAYASLVTDTRLPDAALVALFHQDREGTKRGAIYVMEKRGNGWSFFRFDQDGRPAEAGDECASCHAAGVADSLFGLPRSAALE